MDDDAAWAGVEHAICRLLGANQVSFLVQDDTGRGMKTLMGRMLSDIEAQGAALPSPAPNGSAAVAPAPAEPVDPALCRCGSGLRGVRCCQLDLATIALPAANRHLQPAIERAVQALNKVAADTAERLALEILELSPGQVDMLWLLSRIRLAQGRPGTRRRTRNPTTCSA